MDGHPPIQGIISPVAAAPARSRRKCRSPPCPRTTPVYPVHMATLFDETFWDERYSGANAVWSGNPNPQLVAEASGLAPGRALDVGCGEGADALWLVERGWQVNAVDISRIALQKAAQHASTLGTSGTAATGTVAWEQHDLLQWTPPESTFDLVTAQFMHLPKPDRDPLYARLAAAVATGGSLLIVGHSASDILAGARRPDVPDLFFTASDIAGALEENQWRIEVAESRPRSAENADGRPITIHDEVMRAVRLP